MTEENRSAFLDGVFECGKTELAKLGAHCEQHIGNFMTSKPHLLAAATKECTRLASGMLKTRIQEFKTPNDAVTLLRQSQFTPKMKANAESRLLSSLV